MAQSKGVHAIDVGDHYIPGTEIPRISQTIQNHRELVHFSVNDLKRIQRYNTPQNLKRFDLKVATAYAVAQKDGTWLINGDAIRWDENGWLVDGQHRVAAGIMSGMGLITYVITGLPADVFPTINRGKNRNQTFILSEWMASKKYDNCCTRIARVNATVRLVAEVTGLPISTTGGEDAYAPWDNLWCDAIEWSIKTFNGHDPEWLRKSPFCSAFIFAYRANPVLVREFGELLAAHARRIRTVSQRHRVAKLVRYMDSGRRRNDARGEGNTSDIVIPVLTALMAEIDGHGRMEIAHTGLRAEHPALLYFHSHQQKCRAYVDLLSQWTIRSEENCKVRKELKERKMS